MFTGIIEQVGRVERTTDTGELTVFEIETGIFDDNALGDSISVNGTCLTVTEIKEGLFTVEMVNATKRITSLGSVTDGDEVNRERALTLSTRRGCTFVSGHVDGTGEVTGISHDGEAMVMRIRVPEQLMKYMPEKGSVAVDGISLTLFDTAAESSEIILNLIPETRGRTTLGQKDRGDIVNIEADMLMKHVEHLLGAAANHV